MIVFQLCQNKHKHGSINDEEFKVNEDCEDDNDEMNDKVQEATAVQPHESLVYPQFEQEEENPPVKKRKTIRHRQSQLLQML